MTAPLFIRANTAGEMYGRILTAIYQWGVYVPDQSYALSEDTEIYEKLRRDAVIAHAVQQRRHMVAGRNWYFEPASEAQLDKTAATVMEQLFKAKLRKFSEARFHLAEAVILGSAYEFIEGSRQLVKIGDGVPRNWWVPTRLRNVDRRRFRIENEDVAGADGTLSRQAVWKIWAIDPPGEWQTLKHPEWFVKHVYDDSESTLRYGRGLIDALYFYWRAASIILTEGLGGLERWARGMVIASIEGTRDANTNKPNSAQINRWLDQLGRMVSRHILIKDKSDELDIKETTGTGHQIVRDLLEYVHNACRVLILGSNLPTSADKGGSYALGEVQSESTDDLIEYDREILGESITDDAATLTWRLNLANLADIGLTGAQMPHFKVRQDKKLDTTKEAQTAKTAIEAGIDLPATEVYDKIGYTPPSPGEPVIKGRAAAMASPFGIPPDGAGAEAGGNPFDEKEPVARETFDRLVKMGASREFALRYCMTHVVRKRRAR